MQWSYTIAEITNNIEQVAVVLLQYILEWKGLKTNKNAFWLYRSLQSKYLGLLFIPGSSSSCI